MKAVFFGGGGFRTLPVARGMLHQVPALQGGEIALYDLDANRVEAMALMLQKSPECAASGCRVTWSTSLDEALPGADLVSVSLMAGSPPVWHETLQACSKHSFMGSDQISPAGAFLALKTGKIALALARKMEEHCPDAWLVDFANPVPVVSAVVNSHTKIRALGVCGGAVNHQWDLTRLQGRDEKDPNYDVDVAGVNHGSLILRGTYKGEDLWQIFDRIIAEGFQEPKYEGYPDWAEWWLHWAMPKLLEVYEKHGCTIFSTEGDGVSHFFYEELWEAQAERRAKSMHQAAWRPAPVNTESRAQADAEFQALAHGDLPEGYFQDANGDAPGQRADDFITVRVAQALGGQELKLVASHPCGGRVAGFTDRTVLEYSMYLGADGLRPVPNLYVPPVFQGLMTALATHQTLLGDAIATEDPQVLYEALWAYPVRQNTRAYWALCEDLLRINREEIAETFQGARAYFW